MLTDAITTLPPAGAETTVIPSIVANVTQQTVTMAPTGVTDVQSTLTPVTSAGIVVQNMSSTQSANSLTAVTSGESVQPTPSVGAETVTGSPNTITPMANTDNQIPTTTMIIGGNQGPQTSLIVGDTGMNTSVSNERIQVATDASTGAATDTGMMVSMNQVPSTFATNTEVPTTINMLSPDSSAGASTDAFAASSTIVVNMMPANMSTPSATLSTVIMNSLTTVIPAILNSADVTIPSPVTETMMVNGLISQSSIETSADTPAGNTPEMIAANDLAMTTMTSTDGAVNSETTVVPPVPGTNASNLENNFTIANSTMNPVDSQMAASLVDENIISTRKKKDHLMDLINSYTVKDESTNGSPNLRKREARSPRGYFSSYPGQDQLTNIFFE